ncbi:MAG: DUF29 domain-containing protein [Chloroherpetonaceae bacterium]|nr:DUF29 domain-containing protein [Chloroherpetonaceae bacterium]MCS7210243.1 DUF29 domain-containing protein [Chloroherpetonaceae bacterium]MDW8020776.1 DUF29 domain-containing protein [Chloroherpetonaceae bacterium]MDW8465298.1 DUF29 domain-containing protein [Chloroherpetonaceae bacterium]
MDKDRIVTMDYWQDLAATSHYLTAVAVKRALEEGNYAEAEFGVSELINALSRADKHAVRSHLIRLMTHIIKWKSQPEKRSASWVATIRNAREEIRDYQEANPSLTDEVIKAMWEKCFARAKRNAEDEMQRQCDLQSLSWNEVFEEKYELER